MLISYLVIKCLRYNGVGQRGRQIITEAAIAHTPSTDSLRTQTYFRLSLVPPKIIIFGGDNDSRKYVCVRRLIDRLQAYIHGQIDPEKGQTFKQLVSFLPGT